MQVGDDTDKDVSVSIERQVSDQLSTSSKVFEGCEALEKQPSAAEKGSNVPISSSEAKGIEVPQPLISENNEDTHSSLSGIKVTSSTRLMSSTVKVDRRSRTDSSPAQRVTSWLITMVSVIKETSNALLTIDVERLLANVFSSCFVNEV